MPFLDAPPKRRANVGHSHHLVVVGCVLDVVRVLTSIKRGHPERALGDMAPRLLGVLSYYSPPTLRSHLLLAFTVINSLVVNRLVYVE